MCVCVSSQYNFIQYQCINLNLMRKFCKEKLCLYLANNLSKKTCCHSSRGTNRHKANKIFLVASSHILQNNVVKVNSLLFETRETLELNICSYFRVLCKFPNQGNRHQTKRILNNRRYCFANARLIKRKAGDHVPRSFHRRRHVQVNFQIV